jgi:DNA-binding NarL/FixJ family response regulator
VSIRVAVVDDQALVRGGFAMVLGHQDDIDVVAEAGTGLEAIEVARTHRPDVILMDIRMPEMDGLEATARIVEEADWPVRVLILTTFEPDAYVYRALRAGASGFVLKDIPPEELPIAVRTVANGGALLAPVHHQAPHRPVRAAPRRRHRGVGPLGTSHRPGARGTGCDRPGVQQR